MSPLAAALLAELDDQALDQLAELLAPRLVDRLGQSRADQADNAWLRGAAEIANYLGCPRSRVYALSSCGRLPVERDGSALVAKASDLDAWLRAGGAKRP